MLSTDDVAAAVALSFDTLVNDGDNSWLGMIRIGNATMTMESWPGGGGGTYSHPWTASPAWIIPRFLMGVRPLTDGWERLAIRPLPSRDLTSASIDVLTPRGTVKVAFSVSASAMSLNLTMPGNTLGQVCMPRYIFGSTATCTVTVGGHPAVATNAGGLTCLTSDVGGGDYLVVMSCVL